MKRKQPGITAVLPMYMGVIPKAEVDEAKQKGAPHVYGGDPRSNGPTNSNKRVLPMYMGVILYLLLLGGVQMSAPHVYGGDPWPDN